MLVVEVEFAFNDFVVVIFDVENFVSISHARKTLDSAQSCIPEITTIERHVEPVETSHVEPVKLSRVEPVFSRGWVQISFM